MKAMRKLVWMLLAVSMVGFTSCDSDDDDWIDDGGQGSGGSDEGGVVTPSGSLGMLPQQKKIKIPIISL